MKIYNEVVIDMNTGETVYEDSFEYNGPVDLCCIVGQVTPSINLEDWQPDFSNLSGLDFENTYNPVDIPSANYPPIFFLLMSCTLVCCFIAYCNNSSFNLGEFKPFMRLFRVWILFLIVPISPVRVAIVSQSKPFTLFKNFPTRAHA